MLELAEESGVGSRADPFQLKLDSLSSSIHRLSLTDLARQQMARPRPARPARRSLSSNSWAGSLASLNNCPGRSSRAAASQPASRLSGSVATLSSPPSLEVLPGSARVSPLSPSFSHAGISVSPRFNWRQVETALAGTTEERLLTQLTALHQAITLAQPGQVRQLAAAGFDLVGSHYNGI